MFDMKMKYMPRFGWFNEKTGAILGLGASLITFLCVYYTYPRKDELSLEDIAIGALSIPIGAAIVSSAGYINRKIYTVVADYVNDILNKK